MPIFLEIRYKFKLPELRLKRDRVRYLFARHATDQWNEAFMVGGKYNFRELLEVLGSIPATATSPRL